MAVIDLQHAADIQAIKALIQAFFDSINAADPKSLQGHFFPSAGLTIIRQDPPRPDPEEEEESSAAGKREEESSEGQEEEKLTVVIRTDIERFVKLLEEGQKRREGQPPGPVLHEAPDLAATEVRLDGLFATAWAPFRVTFDGVLHHYGTMAYTLGKTAVASGGGGGGAKEWKIEGLTQNYRRTPGWPESHGADAI